MSTVHIPAHIERLKEKSLPVATLRNGGIGFLIGSVVLVLQWNKARKNEQSWDKFKTEWFRYLMKYPLFLASFTLLYKFLMLIGRQLAGYRGLHSRTGQRLFGRKLSITISAFFCGFFAQRLSPVFSWNWALYALLRSLLGIARLIIPADLQPFPADLYFLVHGCLPWLITYNISTVPASYLNFFKSCLNVSIAPYSISYEHRHGQLPNCANTVHVIKGQPCLPSFVHDGIKRYKVCLCFYLKFYVLTSLVGGRLNFLKRVLFKQPLQSVLKILESSIRSSLFLFVGFHFPSRIHCLYRYVLLAWHRWWKRDPFAVIACNQMWMLMLVSAVVGTVCLRLEPSVSKRSDIALFSTWRLVEQYIRKIAKLESYDRDADHRILGDPNLSASLFALSIALTVYVHLSDTHKLKALERSIMTVFLA